jgi:hypothetical protein
MGVTVPFVYAQFRRARSGVETTGRGHIHDDDDVASYSPSHGKSPWLEISMPAHEDA